VIYRKLGGMNESVNAYFRAKRNIEQRFSPNPVLFGDCQRPLPESREKYLREVYLGLATTYKSWAKQITNNLVGRRTENNDEEIFLKDHAVWSYYLKALKVDPLSHHTLKTITQAMTNTGGYGPHLLLLGNYEKKVELINKCWEKVTECAVRFKHDIRQEASDIAPNVFLSPRGEKAISQSWSDYSEGLTFSRKGALEKKAKHLEVVEGRRQQWISGETPVSKVDEDSLRPLSHLFNKFSVSAAQLQRSLGMKPRLRVGYLVSDFAKYSTVLMRKLFYGGHSPLNIDHVVVAFCQPHEPTRRVGEEPVQPPGLWARLQRPSPFFTFIPFYGIVKVDNDKNTTESVTAEEIAEVLNELRLDILIDVNINPLLEVLCYRPAALQLSWMGRPFTSGSSCIDYFITDPVVLEPYLSLSPSPSFAPQLTTEYLRSTEISSKLAEAYSEKLLILPETLYITEYTNQDRVDSAPSRGDPSLEARKLRAEILQAQGLPPNPDLVVLANFNQLWKIDCSTFETWGNILERTPSNVVLWLLDFSIGADTNASMSVIHRYFSSRTRGKGKSLSSRVFFGEAIGGDPASAKRHLERSTLADLFLDSFQYNMGGTAISLLWSGIPIITLPGETLRSRMAASIIQGLGLEKELVVKTRKEYEDRVVKLVTEQIENPENELATIRGVKLKGSILSPTSTALFNTARFIRHLEKGLKLIHEGFVRGDKPDHYFVPPLS
jgi:predicted O-linked N-acetylglucosamine transferase (SPINDLY family)